MPPWYVGAFALAVVVGLPAFLVLVRLNLVRWWSAVLVGIGAGVLVSHMGGAGVRHSAVGGSVGGTRALSPTQETSIGGRILEFLVWAPMVRRTSYFA